jgi:CheY-like chemotaxis protein
MVRQCRRVLIVDHYQDLRKAMADLVTSWGYTVRSAGDGQQALAIALSWQPDIVCLDLALPRMSGCEVARRIIAAFGAERPLLLAVTGLSREVDRQLATAAGFDGFLAKPDHIDLLRDMLGGGLALPAPAALAASTSRAKRSRRA